MGRSDSSSGPIAIAQGSCRFHEQLSRDIPEGPGLRLHITASELNPHFLSS
jgi:hypothetical protein